MVTLQRPLTLQTKRMIGARDARLKSNQEKAEAAAKEKAKKTANGELIREAPQMPSNMFFQHNMALVPPYNVLVDTNFLSHTVQRKLSLLESMMDCLYAKCNPIITSCVVRCFAYVMGVLLTMPLDGRIGKARP